MIKNKILKIPSSIAHRLWPIALVLAILFIFINSSFAANTAGETFSYLNLGVGARAIALGQAYTALATDSEAPYYNAAGLGFLQSNELTTMQTRLALESQYYYLSFVGEADLINYGISFTESRIDDIPETSGTLNAGEVVQSGTFANSIQSVYLGLGRSFTDYFAIGMTGQLFSQNLGNSLGRSKGYSLSPGAMLRIPKVLSLGFQARHLDNRQEFDTGTVEIQPVEYHTGLAVYLGSVLIVAETVQIGDSYTSKGGLEWSLSNFLKLRTGIDGTKQSFGAGVGGANIQLDYAFLTETEFELGDEHRVSLKGRF